MFYLLRLFGLLLTLLSSHTLMALPNAFEAEYDVKKDFIHLGSMRSTLRYDGKSFHYKKETKAEGIVALLSGDEMLESSSGDIRAGHLEAKHYNFHHKNKRKDKRDELRFITATQVEGEYKGQAYQLKVVAGTLDRASLELALMRDIANKTHPLIYHVAERGKAKIYRFNRLPTETVETPMGRYQCEKVEVQHKKGQQSTTLWLAKELDYALVRISHVEKDSAIDMLLRHWKKD